MMSFTKALSITTQLAKMHKMERTLPNAITCLIMTIYIMLVHKEDK